MLPLNHFRAVILLASFVTVVAQPMLKGQMILRDLRLTKINVTQIRALNDSQSVLVLHDFTGCSHHLMSFCLMAVHLLQRMV